MAPTKTTTGTAVKKAAAKVAESKAAEKAVSAAKAAEEKLEKTAKTVEEKVAETAKTVEKKAVKKTAEVKAAARETAEKTVKTRKKKEETNTEVYVQFWGKEVYARDVVAGIKKIWTDEMGKKEADLTDLKVYIKPEDNGAHYVINGEITGFVEL